MNKKLVNRPDDAVDEALSGYVAAHPGLQLLEGHRVVIRADIDSLIAQEKVTLLSGGGSGHEPGQLGYVGHGMLSAVVCGTIFASPPPAAILAALKAIKSPAGTLVIVTNYTGDRLNFGIAVERAKAEGLKIAMVIIGDDCALPNTGNSAGRRGLAGTVLVHKLAGARAEIGCRLDEVVDTANNAAINAATMSVSLSPCAVPGREPSFHLEEDEMELGLGVHGEAGVRKTKIESAEVVVKWMLDHLMSQDPEYQYFKAKPGSDVALMINNLGGTSNLEMLIIAKSAIKYLAKFNVVRIYIGRFMTSLEMAGVSLTVLSVCSKDWIQYLDFQTTAPAWQNNPS